MHIEHVCYVYIKCVYGNENSFQELVLFYLEMGSLVFAADSHVSRGDSPASATCLVMRVLRLQVPASASGILYGFSGCG